MIHPPYHLFYYDGRSIGYLLKKHGFSVVSISHDGKYHNVGSILQALIRIPKSVLPRLALKVNIRDIMTVIARKEIPLPAKGGGTL